jgi:hypothetical protein
MSYCVNCGVELERAQKSCPLCGAVVINPMDQNPAAESNTFPENRDEPIKINRGFWIKFSSIIAAVPIATCLLLNLLYDKRLTWSIFVSASVFMLWAFCTSPFFFARFTYKKMLFADLIAALLGLGLIAYPFPVNSWYQFVALPLAVYCYLAWLLFIFLTRRKLPVLALAAVICVCVSLMVLFLEILLDVYTAGHITLLWSWFVVAPCLAIAGLLLLLDRNKQVQHEIAKRLHF